ncbi:MAG: hypothetical protein ACO1QS_01030 [Verrucomicrobiota bacterium]
MALYYHLAHNGNQQSPCDIGVCFEAIPCPIYITEGIGQGAGGCPLSAAEALEPEWRTSFEKAKGTWLIPYIENLAKGIPLPREEMFWFYHHYHGQPPKHTDIPLPP